MVTLKQVLTVIGPHLPVRSVYSIQAVVNYLEHGRWMKDHRFVVDHRVERKEQVWDAVIDKVGNKKVLYLEFGVNRGDSMRYWSKNLTHPDSVLHGFDSFEGLPETGGAWVKGQFDNGGRMPLIHDPRVRLYKGWFDEVLPDYGSQGVPAHDVLVVNLDADLYSSTIYVLRWLRPLICPGTFIYLDDMSQPHHVERAFGEFLEESGLEFRVVSADRSLAWVCFEAS